MFHLTLDTDDPAIVKRALESIAKNVTFDPEKTTWKGSMVFGSLVGEWGNLSELPDVTFGKQINYEARITK